MSFIEKIYQQLPCNHLFDKNIPEKLCCHTPIFFKIDRNADNIFGAHAAVASKLNVILSIFY